MVLSLFSPILYHFVLRLYFLGDFFNRITQIFCFTIRFLFPLFPILGAPSQQSLGPSHGRRACPHTEDI